MKRLGSVCVVVLAVAGASLWLPRPSWGRAQAAHDLGGQVQAKQDASGHAQVSQPAASGEALFKRICATCHLSLKTGDTGAVPGIRALPRELLMQFSPETILNTLTNGKMQAQASSLTPAERRAVAAYAA